MRSTRGDRKDDEDDGNEGITAAMDGGKKTPETAPGPLTGTAMPNSETSNFWEPIAFAIRANLTFPGPGASLFDFCSRLLKQLRYSNS